VAPAGTPQAVATRLNAKIQLALNSPDISKRFTELGLRTKPGGADEMTELWKSEMAIWPDVTRNLGMVYHRENVGAEAAYWTGVSRLRSNPGLTGEAKQLS
jgi:hypothetical protein